MNFSRVIPGDLIYILRSHRDCTKYIEDTEEAIDKLNEDLRIKTGLTEQTIFDWFLNNLKMRQVQPTGSLYRAFLCLATYEIFNLRISNHNSTDDSAEKSWNKFGQPDIEYQLILEKVPLIHTDATPIEEDMLILGTPILVNEYSITEFCDPKKRGGLIDEIIDILENGSKGSARIQRVQNECLFIRKRKENLQNLSRQSLNESLNEQKYTKWFLKMWGAGWNDTYPNFWTKPIGNRNYVISFSPSHVSVYHPYLLPGFKSASRLFKQII